MRVLALLTDLYGASGGIAEYNRFFIKALSESSGIEKIVILPRRSKKPCDVIALRHSKTGENLHKSRSLIKSEDAVTPTEEPMHLTQPLHRSEDDKRVTVLKEMPNKWWYAFSALATLITKGPFDLIWCGHIYMAPLAALLRFMSRSQLWLQIHGVDAWQKPSRVIQWSVGGADRVLSVSRYSRHRFLEWSYLSPENVKILPNTYDAKRFYRGPKNDEVLAQFGGKGKKILLTVGRLASDEMYKGHGEIIQLLPKLLNQDPDWVYWIAGDGDDRARLVNLTQKIGVSEQVKFLGFINEDKLCELYRNANIFIMLSRGEGFGIVYLEAMASGLQVIAARGDGSVDPLLDGRAGQLVEMSSLSEIINAIKQSGSVNKTFDLAPGIFKYENFSKHLRCLLEEIQVTS